MKRQSITEFWKYKKKIVKILIMVTLLILALIWCRIFWGDNNASLSKTYNSKYYDYDTLRVKDSRFDGEKIVHLDLKGAPPKVSYYEKLFPVLSMLGATGLLIEYEDMFPYQGQLLGNVSALNAYSLEDIKDIISLAEESSLSVIPLVQTFGHLEFMLKLEEFKDVREVPEYPQVICPTHTKTMDVIMDMIEQILEAHPRSTMIHIGADEVYYVGRCERCFHVMSKYNWSKEQLFLEHIRMITQNIHKKFPNIRILMWDDEFRSMDYKKIKDSHISSLVEPVVWKYSQDVRQDLSPALWATYAEIFPKLWIASAFKGATGSSQYLTETAHHLQNHRSWMSLVSEYKDTINFQGIFITGWQRYDHFAILCELLPVGLPSLAMSLRLLLGFDESPLSPPTEVAKLLQCEQPYALIGTAFGTPKCLYPGGEILEIILRYHHLRLEYSTVMEDSRVKGWMSDYNIEHTFSNPQHVESVMTPLDRMRAELAQIEVEMTTAMQDIYDNYTINEFMDSYIKPLSKKLYSLWKIREELLSKDSWPRRPLTESNVLNKK